MSFLSKEIKNIILFAALLAGVFGVYFYFFRGSGTETTLTTENVGGGQGDVDPLLVALLQLRNLKLDTAIFSDPSFNALQNFHKDIPAQPVGRANPFLPLGGAALPAPDISGSVKR